MATKVTLRKKDISKGKQSLYLDFYPAINDPLTGKKTRRHFLKMYVQKKPKTSLEKENKKETEKLAEQIRHKRENELNKPEIYSEFEKEQLRIKTRLDKSFLEYFEQLANKRKSSNHDNWMSALNYLRSFGEGDIRFKDLNEKWCKDFKEYLLTAKSNRSKKHNLAVNSAVSYFNKVKAALREAYKEEFLTTDLNSKVSPIKAEESHRQFLTIDEVHKLIKTPCNDPLMKRAALFSAFTGLRFSDIQKLTWGEVEIIEEKVFIRFKQKKTKGSETLRLPPNAVELMEDMGAPNENVFQDLKYSAYHNKHLYQWIGAAGITKDITFHCFRHTFAVIQLIKGTHPYTLQKLLGHKSIKTTAIYSNIVDEVKEDAMTNIQFDMSEYA
jgi:integrase